MAFVLNRNSVQISLSCNGYYWVDHWPAWWLRLLWRQHWGFGWEETSVWQMASVSDTGFFSVLHLCPLWPWLTSREKKSSFFHLRIRQLQIPKEILKPLTHSLWPGRCCRARQWWPLYSDNLMSRHGIRRLDWGKWPRCDHCGNCDHHWNFVV